MYCEMSAEISALLALPHLIRRKSIRKMFLAAFLAASLTFSPRVTFGLKVFPDINQRNDDPAFPATTGWWQ